MTQPASAASGTTSTPTALRTKVARAVSRTITPRGPKVTEAEARDIVGQIRVLANVAVPEVHKITGLAAAEHLTSPVHVIDRPTWVEFATDSFERLGGEALQKALATANERAAVIGGAASGVQMGAILSMLSTKILGQFDPFTADGEGGLMLVAPNIAQVREELNVDLHDFALWVCLHEQTHRVQFAAAPWLRDHMEDRVHTLMGTLTANAQDLSEDLANLARTLELVKRNRAEGAPVSELLLTPEARAIMSELTGIMSLLEGHANLVMDSVDSSLIPSVKTIRRRFTKRAAERPAWEKAILRWMGMEKKAAQYRDGQKFCQAVVDARGMEGLNRVFERAEHLPSEREIHHPDEWIARVLGPDVPQGSGSEADDDAAARR